MSTSRDYYEILGVQRGATADDIRKAHRRLVRKLHPDVNKASDAAKQFAEVQEAYDVLSDAKKRDAYDRYGHAGVHTESPPPGGAGAGPGGGYRVNIDPEEFSSVFEEIFGGSRGGGRRRAAPFGRSPFGEGDPFAQSERAAAAADADASIRVPFMTAALGGETQLRLGRPNGTVETIDVQIPAGFEEGKRLRLRGKGNAGPRGKHGDLYLTVHIEPHPWFRREGLDLSLEVPITIAEAALGATVSVPLLKGSLRMKVPPGTGSGQRLRLKGHGIVNSKGEKGDCYVTIAIVAPTNLADEDRKALERLGERLPDPRADLPWTEKS